MSLRLLTETYESLERLDIKGLQLLPLLDYLIDMTLEIEPYPVLLLRLYLPSTLILLTPIHPEYINLGDLKVDVRTRILGFVDFLQRRLSRFERQMVLDMRVKALGVYRGHSGYWYKIFNPEIQKNNMNKGWYEEYYKNWRDQGGHTSKSGNNSNRGTTGCKKFGLEGGTTSRLRMLIDEKSIDEDGDLRVEEEDDEDILLAWSQTDHRQGLVQ